MTESQIHACMHAADQILQCFLPAGPTGLTWGRNYLLGLVQLQYMNSNVVCIYTLGVLYKRKKVCLDVLLQF